MKRIPILLILLVLFGVSSFAEDSNPNAASLTSSPVYQKNCAKCHGKNAEGKHFGGPSLMSDKLGGESVDDLRSVISHGKGRMPHFEGKLSSGDIDALILQIKAANAK